MAKAISEKTFEKYKLVVDEWFVNGFNGTKAYQKVYPNAKASTSDSKFRKMVGIGRIENYISQKKLEAEKALRTTHEGLLQELKNWAYSDITETIGLKSSDVKKLPADIRRLVNKFKHTKRKIFDKEGVLIETIDYVELSFVSKEKAMEMIHKHTGFYAVDNEQKSNLVIETREERDAFLAKFKEDLDNEI